VRRRPAARKRHLRGSPPTDGRAKIPAPGTGGSAALPAGQPVAFEWHLTRTSEVVHFRQDGDQLNIQTGRVDVTGVKHGNVRYSATNSFQNCGETIKNEFFFIF